MGRKKDKQTELKIDFCLIFQKVLKNLTPWKL